MTTTVGPDNGLMRDLTEAECWERLARQTTGRIAYVDPKGPVVVPLNYVVRDREIWVQTASYNQLAIHLPDQLAAFQVDHADIRDHTGWSILARGRFEHVTDSHRVVPTGWPDPAPWPGGIRTMIFRLDPTEVTGRQVRRGDPATDPGGPGTIQRSSPRTSTR